MSLKNRQMGSVHNHHMTAVEGGKMLGAAGWYQKANEVGQGGMILDPKFGS